MHIHIVIFKRFLDDCFALIRNEVNAQRLLSAFNNIHQTIQFDLELLTSDNSLTILDVNI